MTICSPLMSFDLSALTLSYLSALCLALCLGLVLPICVLAMPIPSVQTSTNHFPQHAGLGPPMLTKIDHIAATPCNLINYQSSV